MPSNAAVDNEQVARLLHQLADAADPLEPEELGRMAVTATDHGREETSTLQLERRAGRRWVIVAATAAALLMVATGATAFMLTKDSRVPDGLQGALRAVFAGRQCVQAEEATSLLQDRMSALGLADWAVEARPGASGSRCVIAAIDSSHAQVILLPVEAPAVVDAMHAIGAQLMSECLNEDEARALVDSTMDSLGVDAWSIRTDGPLAVPIGQEETVQAHMFAGCTVSSGMGWDTAGSLVIYLST